ncbi:MAG: hypothetical protein COU09_00150 [Candidatus Harrisonbacteria bacterium CG10_big_fil_rev_8_21_14_0_10_44_23]|uniref:TVP38/TMEM64 family membrane protein n=1 Tax=Candidatus Harrisonbacteria bacterium CG10_big_fil_rev_8_21_14_0_10_44_23 TaxID=1974585 RepID=A0A2H0UQZ4_9BACT|nr:MAG: hypothetical protein COU09_00150 [Candidatus Harrisonbacteria bacterium CG10_big_fil_rev_8_21_14_0_10_44_23]
MPKAQPKPRAKKHNNRILKLLLIVASIAIALVLAKTGIFSDILIGTQQWRIIGSILAGIFFVSIFTAVPAAVVLVEIALANTPLEVALFGAIGAAIGDLLIFRFIRDTLSDDIDWFLEKTKKQKIMSIFRLRPLHWLVPIIGAVFIASPIPDEIGLAMMGVSKVKTGTLVIISFLLNFAGIWLLTAVAKGLL